MTDSPKSTSVRVSGEMVGQRLDRALVRLVPDLSRSKLQTWIKEGLVRVDANVVTKTGFVLEDGMELEFEHQEPEIVDLRADHDLDFSVLYEDDDVIAIDKPAGLVAHPNERFQTGTVADLARERFGELPKIMGDDRPGIVHRLDRETSGVMLLGRSESGFDELRRQFKEREIKKTYLALVHGDPRFDSDYIDEPIGTDPRHPERKAVVAHGEGRDAETYYEVCERFGSFSLIACFPKTGRTHQIRVHMAHIGHPLVYDRLYRTNETTRFPLPEDAPAMERHALHAYELEFRHPVTTEKLKPRAELPADFAALVEWLRAQSRKEVE